MNSVTLSQVGQENPALHMSQAEINQQFVGITGAEAGVEHASPDMQYAIGYTAMDAMGNLDAFMVQQTFENLSLDNEQTQQAVTSEEGLNALMQPNLNYDTMANVAPVNVAAIAAMHEQMNRGLSLLGSEDDATGDEESPDEENGKHGKRPNRLPKTPKEKRKPRHLAVV